MIENRVGELLEKSGHSVYWLAQKLELSYKSACQLLRNETQSLKYDTVELLCQTFECEINDLFKEV